MNISTTTLEKAKKIRLNIEKFDVSNMQEMKKAISTEIDENNKNIIIDFSPVSFVDSSGLSVVIATFKQLNSINGELRLCGLQEQPLELLQITQLHKVFTIIDSCDVTE